MEYQDVLRTLLPLSAKAGVHRWELDSVRDTSHAWMFFRLPVLSGRGSAATKRLLLRREEDDRRVLELFRLLHIRSVSNPWNPPNRDPANVEPQPPASRTMRTGSIDAK